MKKKMCMSETISRRITRRIIAVSMALCMVLSVGACGNENRLSSSTKELTRQYRKEKEKEMAEQIPWQKTDQTALSEEFAGAYVNFSINLLKQSRNQQNTMISPLSVLLALEMTRSGAAGETLSQMNSTLYPGISAEQGMEGLISFAANLPDTEEAHLSLANSIWFCNGSDQFAVDEDFLKNSVRNYDAQIFGAPFDERTLKDINQWVSNETNGMVENMIDEIPQEAIMYLINAVAFEAEWGIPYEELQVKDAEFYCEDGSTTQVSMMYGEESRYIEDTYASGFLKPYADGYFFAALLPEEGMSLEEYVNQLDGATFLQTIRGTDDTIVETGLPKFEAETSFEMSEILTEMGMPDAFSADRAEFPGMGTVSEDLNIYIDQVLHKTYISVYEQGTKAGAATAVMMECGGAAPEVQEPKRVILDRPFLYAIVERESGLPVFIGVAENPGN